MAEATIDGTVDIHIPGLEIVKLTASDGETYTSKKFAKIGAVSTALNLASGDFTDESVSATWSDDTVTIELVGTNTTDVPVTLVLFGNLGN